MARNELGPHLSAGALAISVTAPPDFDKAFNTANTPRVNPTRAALEKKQ